MTGALSPAHWAIIAVVLLLLFGGKRLPDAARGLGRSLRIFKAETTALGKGDGEPTGDGEPGTDTTAGATATPVADAAAASRPSERAA